MDEAIQQAQGIDAEEHGKDNPPPSVTTPIGPGHPEPNTHRERGCYRYRFKLSDSDCMPLCLGEVRAPLYDVGFHLSHGAPDHARGDQLKGGTEEHHFDRRQG